ncbi:MAG: hypothetical protein ACFFDH_17255, partial [Promethearchaeota archaeon]
MDSETSNNSQERIRKATELLQKFWWFAFFLIIAPFIVAFIVFWIINFIGGGLLFISLSLSVGSFMFAFLFFYKAFDKYRKNPFFLNKRNNLTARIHVLFLISILSFVTTPLFILISPFDSFIYLPLISFAVLYNIVYYYYYYQPIDFFNVSEEEFKHAKSLELMVKQPYNFLIVVNYVIHIIFLSFTASTNFSWLFALITNLVIYIIAFISTRSQITKIKDNIANKKPILEDLTKFKRRFVVSQVSLIFLLLIQIPSITIITLILAGVNFLSLEVINNFFLCLIFILFYFKSRFYVSFHYTSKLKLYDKSEGIQSSSESAPLKDSKYQKYNSYLSCVLILLISLYSFSIGNPYLIIIVLPFIYILLYYEQKFGLCSKIYNKYVILLNTIAILISISFGIIPILLETKINFLIFCLSLYFVLEIFARYEYFLKESILVYQNLLAIISIGLLMYTFFPVIIFQYITFTSNPFIILISNILLHAIFISATLLISQYVLGIRYFREKSPLLFRRFVLANNFIIEIVIFIFINFRIYFLIDELVLFLQILLISSILFPIVFLGFLYLNYVLKVFPKEYFLKQRYFSLWIILSDVFISLIVVSLLNAYYIILALDLLFASVFYYFILKFGLSLERMTEPKFKKYVKINSYLITFELLYLFFILFYTVFQFLSLFDNIIYSIYLSLALVCGIINLFSKRGLFSEDLYIKINVFILLYSSLIAFYLFLRLTFYTFFVFIIPLMVSSVILFLPFFYLRKKKLYPKFTSKSILINSILFSSTISLIPTIIGLELFYKGIYFDIVFFFMTVVNFTLYIMFSIFTIYSYMLNKVKNNEKRVK